MSDGIRVGRAALAGVVLTFSVVAPHVPVGAEEPDPAAPAVAVRTEDASEYRDEAEGQLATPQREAARLRETGAAAQADVLEKRVVHFRDRLAGKAAPEGGGPELHVVGVYEGPPAGGVRRGFDEHPVGSASVGVAATDRPAGRLRMPS